jgi:hypothetical protein
MILGAERRVRPLVELVERTLDLEPAERQTWPARDHRDRGHFLTARLYPDYEQAYAVASESM